MDKKYCAQLTIILTLIFNWQIASGQIFDVFANRFVPSFNQSTCNRSLECIDCHTGRACTRINGTLLQFGITYCEADSDMPFCNQGICSKIPGPGCSTESFVCPTPNGTYPNPSDCTSYHRCADSKVVTNQCPRNNVYNHELGQCKYRQRLADCVTINCAGQDGKPYLYPRDKSIYGRCILGQPYILGRCMDYEEYDFNQEACVRHCYKMGAYPANPKDPNACGKYIICAEILPRKYEPVEMQCACNEGFDQEKNRCVLNAPCMEKKTRCK